MSERSLNFNMNSLAILLKDSGLSVATVESATSGAIAAMLTSVEGSSLYFTGAIVAYSCSVKMELLGIDRALTYSNCVNMPVTVAMAVHGSKLFKSNITIATTGFLDRSMSSEVPPGTLNLAIFINGRIECYRKIFGGDRIGNRRNGALYALKILYKILMEQSGR